MLFPSFLFTAFGAVSMQFYIFLHSLSSTNSAFGVLDLTVRSLVASFWIYPSHFFMYYLTRSPGSVGVTTVELPGGSPSEFDFRRSTDDGVRTKVSTAALRARRAPYLFAYGLISFWLRLTRSPRSVGVSRAEFPLGLPA